ncbi:unnamed protein product [Rangifer tarandus platyrhynchus]|uniref:Uncharacterized protein n=2 Tax=Rangifer tarandus platyrhynchus TaxID=3082113 RepID=A0ABN9A5U5_RANTA|nr:unnamed protein product [Rangifer tarandus platyrhynchus]CAI9714195.1 unnamed protein product [Rangifer tarandus platyrhynchus]
MSEITIPTPASEIPSKLTFAHQSVTDIQAVKKHKTLLSLFQKNNVKNQKRNYESILATLHLLNQRTALSSSLKRLHRRGWRPGSPRELPNHLWESPSDLRSHRATIKEASNYRASGRLGRCLQPGPGPAGAPTPSRGSAQQSRVGQGQAAHRAQCAEGLPRGDTLPPGRRRLALCGLEADVPAAETQTASAERPHRPPRVMGCLRLIRWRRWGFTAEGESRPSTSGAVLRLTPTDSIVDQNAFFKGIQLDTFNQQYFLK